jgi:type I site-specific restriction-modification system R (restriction) subunit
MWNRKIRVHLIDTPGFDDQSRSDTEVLRDIAGWMALTYKNKIKLSGVIYLHRITDPRMGGSQMRNLSMFKKLCGPECFPAVTLVTTFWGVADLRKAADREQELISKEEYWGFMAKRGSSVVRHAGDEESALDIIDDIVKRQMTVVLDIQDKMVNKGLDLDETPAGRSLNKELIEQREKDKKEMERLEEDMRQAIIDKDEELIRVTAHLQDQFQEKIEKGDKNIRDLQASLENLKEERDKELKKIQQELQERAEQLAIREKEWQEYRASNTVNLAEKEENEAKLEEMKQQIRILERKSMSKNTGKINPSFSASFELTGKW